MQGQFLIRIYESNRASLDADIEKALAFTAREEEDPAKLWESALSEALSRWRPPWRWVLCRTEILLTAYGRMENGEKVKCTSDAIHVAVLNQPCGRSSSKGAGRADSDSGNWIRFSAHGPSTDGTHQDDHYLLVVA